MIEAVRVVRRRRLVSSLVVSAGLRASVGSAWAAGWTSRSVQSLRDSGVRAEGTVVLDDGTELLVTFCPSARRESLRRTKGDAWVARDGHLGVLRIRSGSDVNGGAGSGTGRDVDSRRSSAVTVGVVR